MGSHTSDENIYLLGRDEAETERYVPLSLMFALLEPAFNCKTREPLLLEVAPFNGVSLQYHSQHIISTLRHAASPSTAPVTHSDRMLDHLPLSAVKKQVPSVQVDVDGALQGCRHCGIQSAPRPLSGSPFLLPIGLLTLLLILMADDR